MSGCLLKKFVTSECQHLLWEAQRAHRPCLCSQHRWLTPQARLCQLTPCSLVSLYVRKEPSPKGHLSDRGRKQGGYVVPGSPPKRKAPSGQAHRALPHSCSSFSPDKLGFEWPMMSSAGLQLRRRLGSGQVLGLLGDMGSGWLLSFHRESPSQEALHPAQSIPSG